MHTMKLRGLVLALALVVVPSLASADPITLTPASWAATNATFSDSESGLTLAPFWSGLSWDCTYCGVGYLIDAEHTLGIEYLHNGAGRAAAFRFDPSDITLPTFFAGITAWTNGRFGVRADGVFTYDSGTGHVSNSWDNPEQYALFRIVGPETTRYFLGIEDILVSYPVNDHDYNDYIATFQETHRVPEPTSLALMGVGALGLALRRRRQAA